MLTVTAVGDFQPGNETHDTMAEAMAHSAAALGISARLEWTATDQVAEENAPHGADALWIAPGSPYKDFEGALEAISRARISGLPTIGTCAGFQHAVIEFARNVAGLPNAHHAEYEAGDGTLVVDALACSLAGQTMEVSLETGSVAHRAYGAGTTNERYYCRFGLNPVYVPTLVEHGLVISGRDQDGEPRIVEVRDHPFFVATLFVPQTRSTTAAPHPLVTAFLAAALERQLAGYTHSASR